MKIILLAALITMASVVSAESWYDSIESGATLEVEWAYETDNSQSQKKELVFQPDVSVEFSDTFQLNLAGRLRHEEVGDIDEDRSQLHLREFTLETNLGETYLSVGKQQIVWGKADGIKVLDVINPQEWREFILDDFDDSRLPLWAMTTETPVGDSTLQILAIFEQQYHERAELDESFYISSPLFVPSPPAGIPVDIKVTREPKRVFKDADIGVRVSGFRGGWDYSLNYFYHYDDDPALFREIKNTGTGPNIIVRPEHKRTHLIGGALSNAFGDLTLRSEIGYSIGRYMPTNNVQDDDGVVKSDELAYVIGFDWFGFSDTLLSAQLFQRYLIEHEEKMLADRNRTTITFLLEQDYWNETIKARLLWLHSLDQEDGVIRPKLTYELSDIVNLRVGADIFYGDNQGGFGQFDHLDRLFIGTEVGI